MMEMIEDAIKLGVYVGAVDGKSIVLELGCSGKFTKVQMELIRKAVADNKASADRLIDELVGDARERWRKQANGN